VHPSVPTWNYAVVHVHGLPAIIEDTAKVESMLRALVQANESKAQSPWQMKLPDDYLKKMIGAIVAFEVRVSRMQGKFKLSQNRPAIDRANVVAALEQAGNDDAGRLAALMRQIVEL
jgi:transcriptional regulator